MLENVIGVVEASKITGLAEGTIKNYCAAKKIVSKKIGKSWVIDKTKLEEWAKMQNIIKGLNLREGTFVTYYNNVNELIDDGMDIEILDEKFYVFGNKYMKPSEIKEALTIVEVESSDDTPIFLEGQEDELKNYFD
ncbi:MAG TPA: helix-turn-helix domain-containing protein [Pseudogracilibacillus sp.]|nr:helix-turn-helix domain-containing protein [Pseudogracilibacillus sp.]